MASSDGPPAVDAPQNPFTDAPTVADAAPDGRAMPDARVDAAIPDAATSDGQAAALQLDTIDPDNALASAALTGAVLSGSGFDSATTVTVGGSAATNCTLLSSTQLRCDLPAAGNVGHVDVVVARGSDHSTLAGGFTWTAPSTDVTWCDVQWPPNATATANTVSPYVYGQIYQSGVTDASNTPAAGIGAQLGFGTSGSDPRTDNGWRYVAAVPNPSYDFAQNNDEYYAHATLPAGTYGYVYRFTLDGGLHYTYCDLDTANNGFDPTKEGTLTVTP